ncbi:uncharacterized protein LOC135688810 isoform X2 [Rhopilema esculentum]|uniref:uncharacterized protein LOC135688810 isoform X2 n=1 Tax=Rhopilema esculentum TaxID=499914 RepID=UPI0031D21015
MIDVFQIAGLSSRFPHNLRNTTKACSTSSVQKSIGGHKCITGRSLKANYNTVNDSMSDIFSESDFESEVGYASCEKDDSATSDVGKCRQANKARKRRQRRHKLDQLKKYEIYSNDSDTTIDESGNSSRKLKSTRIPRGAPEVIDTSLIVRKALSDRDSSPKNIRRPRNGSKASWTDSGVSMSKTDSQPSTLGDRSNAARIMSKKRAGSDELLLDRCEDSPVELLRGEINRRSRSVSEYLRQVKDQRQNECRSAPLQPTEGVEKPGSVDMTEAEQKEHRIRRQGSQRHPEIIKKDSFGRKILNEEKHKGKKVPGESSCNKSNLESQGLSKMENEIIRQLVENAREADRKESIPSSPSSCHSKDEAIVNRKSRFQRIKALLRTMKPRLHSDSKSSSVAQGIDCNGRCHSPFSFDNYLSDDVSIHSRCIDENCNCDCDDIIQKDQLSRLGRTIPAKKRSFLSRFFKSSSKQNIDINLSNGRMYRSGSHCETDFGRKRSGSTRSLPESLRHLWLKAMSKSVDNINTQRCANQFLRRDPMQKYELDCKRSRSSCSLVKPPFYPYFPMSSSKSCEALSLHSLMVRSPPTPVRRSASLRSLNITKNYDIATHVLQARVPPVEHAENNNLFYHPYFEGHAARDDFIKGTDQNVILQCYCCADEKLMSPGCSRKYEETIESMPNVISMNMSRGRKDSGEQYRLGSEDCCSYNQASCKNGLGTPNCFCDVIGSRRNCHDHQCDDDNDDDDVMIVAPLKVTITEEKHAEKVRLKTSKNIDTFV